MISQQMNKSRIGIFFGCILLATSITSHPASKQEQMNALLAQVVRANTFNSLYPQEKVYLHFDNTAYFSGETMWFSANVVNATATDTARSKVLYVEILSPTGVVVQQQKLKVEDGRCHGAFPLIDAGVKEANAKRGVLGYPSGFYEVRAYTRSMLNFDDNCHFSRVFPIYDSPEKEGDYANPIMKRYVRREEERPEYAKLRALNMEFFPEGGHLVGGVENRIAFKATDSQGLGVGIESLMIGEEQITLATQHLGMGCFSYTPPLDGKRHKASVRYNNKTYTFALPDVEKNGYAVQVTPCTNDTLSVTISTLYPDTGRLLGVALMHAGTIAYIDTLTMYATACHKPIYTAALTTGVHQLYLFDAEGTIHASRMLFCNNGTETSPITIAMDKPSYKPFEKVEMHIKTTCEEERHLSLAVRDAADYGTGYHDDIRTYMLLSSELKGYIERPDYYFEADDKEHHEALDRLMMVQGWSRYSFEKMQQPIAPDAVHYAEESLVLEGHALHPRKDEAMAGLDINLKLYSPDRKMIQKITATTDEQGYWGVNLEDFEGQWDLNIQTFRNGEPIVSRIRLERSSFPSVLPYSPAAIILQHHQDTATLMTTAIEEEEWKLPTESFLLEEVEVEGHRRYVDFCTFQAFNVEKDKELMIDKGEYTYTVADYLRDKGYDVTYVGEGDICQGVENKRWLMTQHVVNGYRTLWNVIDGKRNHTGGASTPGFDIDIADVKSVLVFDTPHSYMGNPEVHKVLSMGDMLWLQENAGFPAGLYVVEIHLYPNRKNNLSLYKNTRQTTFDGYSPKVEYYSSTYPNGPIQGDADYRRTLYWNPDVKLSEGRADVVFYNNSYTQHFEIRAEGFTRHGEFIVYDSDDK